MSMSSANAKPSFLAGQLLIAMPQMSDPRFQRSVIYMCAHSEEGAMGLVVNKVLDTFHFSDLLDQLGLPASAESERISVHFGGPVETGRGFVLHSAEYELDSTLKVDEQLALTATVDVLKDIVEGRGPKRNLLALGYAGWGPGQLETEVLDNAWLTAPADPALIFAQDVGQAWEKALKLLHIDLSTLSGEAGHA
jgi:putative transcriptional regulator